MKKKNENKPPEFDWSITEEIPFSVMLYSSVIGWMIHSRPSTPEEAWKRFNALDGRKMLLNYGSTLVEG
jgi:hypothetical protein